MVLPGTIHRDLDVAGDAPGGAGAAGRRRVAPRKRTAPAPLPIPWVPLGATVGVMMLRAWTIFGIQAFIPSWYKSLGYDAGFYGPLATTIVLAGAAGNVGWGSLADRFGRRAVVIITTAGTIPVVLLFAQLTGPIAFPLAALLGFLAASTAPLMLVTAQQLMAGRAGFASGLILGLGFVTGAIGVPVMGAIGDAYGMPAAMRSQAIVAIDHDRRGLPAAQRTADDVNSAAERRRWRQRPDLTQQLDCPRRNLPTVPSIPRRRANQAISAS